MSTPKDIASPYMQHREPIDRKVAYIIREGFGIPEGYCIMGLEAMSKIPPALSVVEAGNALWALLKSHLYDPVTGERGNFHPVAESVLKHWTDVCDASLSQGEAVPAPANASAAWIPLTERYPERGTRFLLYNAKKDEVTAGLFDYDMELVDWTTKYHFTHWMPLPSPPTAQKP